LYFKIDANISGLRVKFNSFFFLLLINVLFSSFNLLLFFFNRDWMSEHKKSYDSLETMKRKFATFVENHLLVRKLNEMHLGKTEFALNQFADMSPSEFKSTVLMRTRGNPTRMSSHKYLTPVEDIDLPDSFDWRDEGAVTPIKDQGSVGTCWAFSATQNIEGQYKLKGNPLTNLSVEQIVDCDGTQDPDSEEKADCGVYGGWPFLAIEYVQRAVCLPHDRFQQLLVSFICILYFKSISKGRNGCRKGLSVLCRHKQAVRSV
jgi:hypothetical protein